MRSCKNTCFPFNSDFFCSNTVIVVTNAGGNNRSLNYDTPIVHKWISCYGDLILFYSKSFHLHKMNVKPGVYPVDLVTEEKSGQVVLGQKASYLQNIAV